MKKFNLLLIIVLIFTMALAGCTKKEEIVESQEPAFEDVDTDEDVEIDEVIEIDEVVGVDEDVIRPDLTGDVYYDVTVLGTNEAGDFAILDTVTLKGDYVLAIDETLLSFEPIDLDDAEEVGFPKYQIRKTNTEDVIQLFEMEDGDYLATMEMGYYLVPAEIVQVISGLVELSGEQEEPLMDTAEDIEEDVVVDSEEVEAAE